LQARLSGSCENNQCLSSRRVAQLGEHLLCKRVPALQRLQPLLDVSMFSTISGDLLLARSKPRSSNYIGFWYSLGTAGFENGGREPLSETENLRHCLNVSHVENVGDFNANRLKAASTKRQFFSMRTRLCVRLPLQTAFVRPQFAGKKAASSNSTMLTPTALFSSAKRLAFIEAACDTRSAIFLSKQPTMCNRYSAS
jgi:hypothetical protein